MALISFRECRKVVVVKHVRVFIVIVVQICGATSAGTASTTSTVPMSTAAPRVTVTRSVRRTSTATQRPGSVCVRPWSRNDSATSASTVTTTSTEAASPASVTLTGRSQTACVISPGGSASVSCTPTAPGAISANTTTTISGRTRSPRAWRAPVTRPGQLTRPPCVTWRPGSVGARRLSKDDRATSARRAVIIWPRTDVRRAAATSREQSTMTLLTRSHWPAIRTTGIASAWVTEPAAPATNATDVSCFVVQIYIDLYTCIFTNMLKVFISIKPSFKVFVSYILIVIIVIDSIICKGFILLCISEWPKLPDIWRRNICCITNIMIAINIIIIIPLPFTDHRYVSSTVCWVQFTFVERGSSVGGMPDSQSREPGFESPLLPFRSLGIFFHFTTPQSTQLYKWVPGYRQWWKCEWVVVAQLLHG